MRDDSRWRGKAIAVSGTFGSAGKDGKHVIGAVCLALLFSGPDRELGGGDGSVYIEYRGVTIVSL